MSHHHVASPVATTSFDQIDRLVLNAMSPGTTTGTSGQFGSLTFSGPANGQVISTDELMFWFPDATGAANLVTTRIEGGITNAVKLARVLGGPGGYNIYPGAIIEKQTTSYGYTASTHDPDVRALYPHSPVRPTHACCVIDVNMGGGHGRLRATPVTKDMFGMPLHTLQASLMSDAHTVHKLPVGGQMTKRFKFKPWVQSRRALGDFSIRTKPLIDAEIGEVTSDHFRAGYHDEFPYGGWMFAFENISMAAMGAVPLVTITSSVTIQVQLGLGENHMAHRGPTTPIKDFIDGHSMSIIAPQVKAANKDAIEEARAPPAAAGKKGSLRGSDTPAAGKKARDKQQANDKARKKALRNNAGAALQHVPRPAKKAIVDGVINALAGFGRSTPQPLMPGLVPLSLRDENRRLRAKPKGQARRRQRLPSSMM